jgi:hypothetical protein
MAWLRGRCSPPLQDFTKPRPTEPSLAQLVEHSFWWVAPDFLPKSRLHQADFLYAAAAQRRRKRNRKTVRRSVFARADEVIE